MIAEAHPTLRFADALGKGSEAARAILTAPDLHATYNGRAALYQVFRAFRESREGVVLVPAFHCPTVVDPVLRAGFDVAFYRIREDLSVDAEDLAGRLSDRVAAVVGIHYLGFPTPLGVSAQDLRKRGILLVEDWAHSFLKAGPAGLSGGEGDAVIYSFYKLAPTFTGGAFQIRSPALQWRGTRRRVSSRRTIVMAKRLVEQAIQNSGSNPLRAVFSRLEEMRVGLRRRDLGDANGGGPPVEPDPYPFEMDLAESEMPWLSRAILRRCDLEAIVAARRRNYAVWNETLVETPRLRKVKPALPPEVCPWAFPVLLDERGAHDHLLRARGVPLFTFGERLHGLFHETAAGTFPETESLSQNLLLLSAHQNLTPAAVRAACDTVNAHFRSVG